MYVLSITHPPENGAAFGKAVVSRAMASHAFAVEYAVQPLMVAGLPYSEATLFASEVWAQSEEPGAVVTHKPTGITFRIDPADNVPHPCPCCDRLVLPTDHLYAYAEDAYCLGCFTWSRNVEACLPENTAHSHKEN